MPAGKLKLPPIEKGATYTHTLTWKDSTNTPINLTGCTAKLQARPDASSAIVLVELSTTNNRIVITPLEGKIQLYISDEDTTTIQGLGGVYDLEIYHPNGYTTRLLEGKWSFKPEVTRV